MRSQQKSWSFCGVQPRTVPRVEGGGGVSPFPSTSRGRSRALDPQDEPQSPSQREGDPRWPVPGVGAPATDAPERQGWTTQALTPGHPRSPGAVRENLPGQPRCLLPFPAVPQPAPRGWAVPAGSRAEGAAACEAGEEIPPQTHPHAPGGGSRRTRPRGSCSPARRSREPLLQRRRDANFPRKTLGPGALRGGPRLSGFFPRHASSGTGRVGPRGGR